MRPGFLNGDLVEVEPCSAGFFNPGIIVSVQPANSIPDAHIRGMSDVYTWSYWVFFADGSNDKRRGRGIRGPFLPTELRRVR